MLPILLALTALLPFSFNAARLLDGLQCDYVVKAVDPQNRILTVQATSAARQPPLCFPVAEAAGDIRHLDPGDVIVIDLDEPRVRIVTVAVLRRPDRHPRLAALQ